MKKLIGLLLLIATAVFAANFHGHQSLNGLNANTGVSGATSLFTAPITGPYFIRGTLSLPMASQGTASGSQAIALLYKNSSIIYTGVTGASGFAVSGLTLAVGDVMKVGISSGASIDQGLNVIKGDVFFGNGY